MNILLTGSEGFIGMHVRKVLEDAGHNVVGIDSMEPRVHGKGAVPSHDNTIVGLYGTAPWDIFRDKDVVIHLAGQVGVADSIKNPLRYFDHNTLQTAQFYAKLRQYFALKEDHNLSRVIVASSSSIYGNVGIPFTEAGPARPCNVYGLTKYDQEKMTLMLPEVEPVALRFFNIYGPGQAASNKFTGVMANFARDLLNDKAPKITEDGNQWRDFTYVVDVADAVLCVVEADKLEHSIYNVCTGIPTTMRDATVSLAAMLGKSIVPELPGWHRPGDQRHVVGSPLRIQEELGWYGRPYSDGVRDYAQAIRTD